MSWSAWVPWLRRKHPLSKRAGRQVPTVPRPTDFAVGTAGGQVSPDPDLPLFCDCVPDDEYLHTEACWLRWKSAGRPSRRLLSRTAQPGSLTRLRATGPARFREEGDPGSCRVMFTRACPISGCDGLPCARFEDDDESRWDADKATWERPS